jgi:hypothetical protein
LFGILKRFLAQGNRLDAVSIQTKHITSVVWAFLAAAVPVHIVNSFELFGICRVVHARRLLIPLPSPFAEVLNPGSDDSDGEELRVFVEECAELLSDFGSDNDQ